MSAKTLAAGRSGLYRAPADLASLKKQAREASLAWVDLPLQDVSNKKQFMAQCVRQMKLPSYFGGNWDALADCVRDFNWMSAKGYVLHISGSDKLAAAAPSEFQTALAVLGEAAEFWKNRNMPFVVLCDGAGNLPTF